MSVRHAQVSALWVRLFLGLLLIGALPKTVHGWSYSLFSQLDAQSTEAKTRNKLTGETTDSSSRRFSQRYNLNLRHNFFPFLSFQGGTTWEETETVTESDGSESTNTFQSLRPYGSLRLSNPLYQLGVDYSESRFKSEPEGGSETTTTRKEFSLGGGLTPVGLPSLGLRYGRIHAFDDPLTRETVQNDYRLDTSYDYRNLGMNYSYNRTDLENLISDSSQEQQSHNGRLRYNRRFGEGRSAFSGSYGFTYSTTEFQGAQPDPVTLGRSAGLFSTDDTPEDDELDFLNALIDSNTETSAGINLGVGGGDQTVFFNIGLDLGFVVPVDRLFVWVDKRVEGAAVNGFIWRVYVSDRNDEAADWNLIQGPGPASFSSFFDRFEIAIPRTEARFIKVVVQPLSVLNPAAPQFQDLLVTEMEALILPPPGTSRNESLAQDVGMSLRHRISEKTSISYNTVYRQNEALLLDRKNFYLSNNVNASHAFSRVLKGSAGLSRTDQWGDSESKATSHNLNASLKGDWSPVFSQALSFSSTQSSGAFDSSRYSVLLRNQLRPYQGWTLGIDAGESWTDNLTSTLLRVRSSIRPHPKVSFSLGYSGTFSQGGEGSSTSSRHQYSVQAFYAPVATLSLSASLQGIVRAGENRVSQSYSINWSPWSGGDLQFAIAYSEFLSPSSDLETRQLSPQMNWRISQHFSLNASYAMMHGSTLTQETDSQILRGTLKMIF